jgi:hypothetical protein
MGRLRLAWLVAIGLTATGGALAHALVYAILLQGGAHGGHAAGRQWGLCLAVCGTVAVAGLVVFGVARTPLWIFALLPPLGFAFQAQLEWTFTTGMGGGVAGLAAAILLGAFVQVPFALAAYLAARGLLTLVAALAGGRTPSPRSRRPGPAFRLRAVPLRAFSLLWALGLGQRAPPRRGGLPVFEPT